MLKRLKFQSCLLFALGPLAVLIIFSRPGITDCLVRKCPPTRDFSVRELDIPNEFFPEPELASDFYEMHESSGSIEDGIKTIYWDKGNGLAVYIVERFRDAEPTIGGIINNRLHFGKEYEDQRELEYQSAAAQETFIGCGLHGSFGYRCEFSARYYEYFVHFNSYIDEDMTFEEFEQIVNYIDELFTEKLTGSR